MTRAKTIQPGEFLAILNPAKDLGEKRPAFNGFLHLPFETSDRPLALWIHRRSNGQALLSGRTGHYAEDLIDALSLPNGHDSPEPAPSNPLVGLNTRITVKPNDIILFRNTRKTKTTPNRPGYLGYYNPGQTHLLMRLAVWAHRDQKGQPFLFGTLTPDRPYQSQHDAKVPYE